MKNCPNCHTLNEDTNVVCTNCGYLFNSANQEGPNFQGNGYQPKVYEPVGVKNNGFAIASLVLGLVSIVCCASFITAILAIIFGFVGRNSIRQSNGAETGSGMALAGIILGFVFLAMGILYWVAVIYFKVNPGLQSFLNSLPTSSSYYG